MDQRRRWQEGGCVLVEDYLAQHPGLQDDGGIVLDLLYHEILLREERGEAPRLEEYQRRFPQWADALRQQFEVHEALRTASWAGQTAEAPPTADDAGVAAEPPAIPGYEILGMLNQGGMGVIYEARQLTLNRRVALKLLPPGRLLQPQALARFQREARTASALSHPHICTIHDLGEHAGQPFIVMEWVEGQTLRGLLGRRPSPAAVARLVEQVAQALRVAHAAGIVHRDIKPDNIMVRPDGYVKVLDFGVARLLPRAATAPSGETTVYTGTGMLVGTVRYMAPEQARGAAVTGAADVFSLGIVLYELAAGRHPFAEASELGTLSAILSQPVVPPSLWNPEIPPRLEALILQMLAKDARLRPGAAEVEAALRELAGPPRAPASSEGPRPTAPEGRAPRHTVGREPERRTLRAGFESAAAGRGLLLCVVGEPGIGKTTLVEEFLEDLAAGDGACRIARGRCSERLAGAEAYLPILEALEDLLHGTGGETVARIFQAVAPSWYAQLSPPASDEAAGEPAQAPSQERRKREVLALIQEVSRLRPLVLFVDDVHWADASTVDLLSYLGGRCPELRLLVLLTYRPTEMLLERHPFLAARLELQRYGACRELPLGFLSRAEVESYLGLEYPGHRFPADFIDLIQARTEGSPLFVVELLRDLHDRGVIAEAPGGGWVLARALPDFQRDLPATVRGMVQRKIDRLGEPDRRLLVAAGVRGYEFEAAVVAQALGLEPADVEEQLEILDRVQGLVRRLGEQELPDGTLTLRYQFVHALYQDALHASLPPARRASLSAAVARALVGSYGDRSAAIAAPLALLFEAARDWARALDHFQVAAENAARVSAHQEALALARRGLELLQRIPDTPARTRHELRLQNLLGLSLIVTRGYSDEGVERACQRALELCRQLGDVPQLFAAAWGLAAFATMREQLERARGLAEQLLELASRAQDPALLTAAHWTLGADLFYLGEFPAARDHLERGTALYDAQPPGGSTPLIWNDPGVGCRGFGAWTWWMLGYPDRALARSEEGLALARRLAHPHSLAFALLLAGLQHQLRRETQRTLERMEPLLVLSGEQGLPHYWAWGTTLRGWALAAQGRVDEGIAQMRQGLAASRAIGSEISRPLFLGLLADALGRLGHAEEGLATLAEALTTAVDSGDRYYEAELHRLQGELWLQQEAEPAGRTRAETCFRQALATARRQGARSLELRAATSLARLCQGSDQHHEARRLLAESCAGFTEGFDTADLRDAQAILGAGGRAEANGRSDCPP